MDAEALRGKVLGTCTLQEVIGSGTMGAVYRAIQSHPSRYVAVKVLLRAASLELLQQIEFLENFRKVIAPVSSLEHRHIVSIYDYGDVDGLAYIVMPHIAGETLEDVLAREGALPLPLAAFYLEQIAAGLDFAHAQGVIHRDLKPANILVSPDGTLLLADFYLTALLKEGKTAQMRLSQPGMLDYMAPEQVLGQSGKEVDGRADLYSLGAILYRMVTGTPPFSGQTLMKVATKHLKMPPPLPRALRGDLPVAAEQPILAALAKTPEERYTYAQDLALAFRHALYGGVAQAGAMNSAPTSLSYHGKGGGSGSRPETFSGEGDRMPRSSETFSREGDRMPRSSETFSREGDRMPTRGIPTHENAPHLSPSRGLLSSFDPEWRTGALAAIDSQSRGDMSTDAMPLRAGLSSDSEQGTTGMFKLTGPAKIVSIPVEGQPGQYRTGILPALPSVPEKLPPPVKAPLLRRMRVVAFALATLLVVIGSFTFLLTRTPSHHPPSSSTATTVMRTPDLATTSTAQAMATLEANTILYDPLAQNIRNWPVASSGTVLYQFINGAYYISNNDPTRIAPAILEGEDLTQPYAYSLTMEEIRGDDNSINNEFGMILRFTSQEKNGKQLVSFYSLEVLNTKGGEYQFWKYDNSQGATVSPWKQLAHHAFGSEFHQGQGPKSLNTFKIVVNGKNFTLIVNGKQVWTVQDGSLTSGGVGMLVNLKGTEVAFSDLRLTYN